MSDERASPDARRATWAVVPFKGRDGKRRLAGLLDGDERAALVRAMLDDVLDALAACPLVDRLVVVSPEADPTAGSPGRAVTWLAESVATSAERPAEPAERPADGLNGALLTAQAVAARERAARLLILPADLPLLAPSDVAAVLAAGRPPAGERGRARIVIAPDGASVGTNALLLEPPTALAPLFGADSFHAHVAWAAELGLRYAIVRRPGLLLDVDTPEDVWRFLALEPVGRAAAVLRSFDLDRRPAWVAARSGAQGHDLVQGRPLAFRGRLGRVADGE